jgi:hypothetical protein
VRACIACRFLRRPLVAPTGVVVVTDPSLFPGSAPRTTATERCARRAGMRAGSAVPRCSSAGGRRHRRPCYDTAIHPMDGHSGRPARTRAGSGMTASGWAQHDHHSGRAVLVHGLRPRPKHEPMGLFSCRAGSKITSKQSCRAGPEHVKKNPSLNFKFHYEDR